MVNNIIITIISFVTLAILVFAVISILLEQDLNTCEYGENPFCPQYTCPVKDPTCGSNAFRYLTDKSKFCSNITPVKPQGANCFWLVVLIIIMIFSVIIAMLASTKYINNDQWLVLCLVILFALLIIVITIWIYLYNRRTFCYDYPSPWCYADWLCNTENGGTVNMVTGPGVDPLVGSYSDVLNRCLCDSSTTTCNGDLNTTQCPCTWSSITPTAKVPPQCFSSPPNT